jgi:hypothetical protein
MQCVLHPDTTQTKYDAHHLLIPSLHKIFLL